MQSANAPNGCLRGNVFGSLCRLPTYIMYNMMCTYLYFRKTVLNKLGF